MRQKPGTRKSHGEKVVKDIRRATRKQYSAEEKIRIVLDGLKGEDSIAELCRREGIAQSLYYSWSKEFLEAGKKRLAGDTARAATSNEVNQAIGLPVALILAAGASFVVSVIVQKSFVVAPEKLVPKLSKISIVKSAKHKFGSAGLFEFGKSLTKLIVFTAVLSIVSMGFQAQILASSFGTAGQVVLFKLDLVVKILLSSAAVALVLGAIDLLWQRQHFLKSHMMSRQDIRDEVKRSEGDPDQKAERMRRGKEISQNRMLLDVPTADVIVVNPTHYAVALRWQRDSAGAAPVCVAKGTDNIAAKIREIAQENAVPVFSDPPTARALHADVEIGQEIAFEHFQAVAAAIRFADQIRKKATGRI